MTMPRIHCNTNSRCEACPIERIDDPKDKTLAADAVRLARNEIDETVSAPAGFIDLSTLTETAKVKASELRVESYIPEVVGSLAIALGEKCSPKF